MIDFGSLFFQLFSMLWWLLPLFIVAALFRSPWFKGVMGEAMVNMATRLFLNKKNYHLIKNVTIPTEDGTTQIDHIIVSRYGIFVVETKNMKGWIFGGEHQKMWTQQIFKSKRKFQNPLHQNYKHTKTLEAALGLEPDKIFSVVVFVGESTFKTAMPENVTKGGGYIRYIKSKTKVLLSENAAHNLIEEIESARLKSSIKTNILHAQHVREIVTEKSAQAQSPAIKACPECGSNMVLRNAKKGSDIGNQFWGCSAFPKCRTVAAHE